MLQNVSSDEVVIGALRVKKSLSLKLMNQSPLILVCLISDMALSKSVYDQEIPQPHTADQPTAPRGRVTKDP